MLEAYRRQEGSIRQVAKRFKISKNTLSELITRFRNPGPMTSKWREIRISLALNGANDLKRILANGYDMGIMPYPVKHR